MKQILAILFCLSFSVFAEHSYAELRTCKDFMKLIEIGVIFDSAKDAAINKALNKIDANKAVENRLAEETEKAISFAKLENKIAECFLDNFDNEIMKRILDERNTKNDNSFYLSNDWKMFMEKDRQKKIFNAIEGVIKDTLEELNLADKIKDVLK